MAEIVIYSKSWCGYCHRAKALLSEKGQSFAEIDVEAEPDKEAEMVRRARRSSVPQIFVGEVHVGGYDDLNALEQSGELDALLTGKGGSE
ncbi:MAG: glutaredoxin 3 [Deltaproteobacteria bacterium]|nr:glutaredoxin 3 [Deltaproteobacteria bacterium]